LVLEAFPLHPETTIKKSDKAEAMVVPHLCSSEIQGSEK
jgi:hypothetical protein